MMDDPLLLARLQFAITTIYHFWMVPLTIGLGPVLVWMQHHWNKTGDEKYYRMVRFWGKIFLINFVAGVATGIVQEFQFGMAWSEYSRTVGDVFGVPLAMEALLAFFFESIFLGLWIFGWHRLSKKVHLLCLIAAITGSVISAYFIIVANSWMQHPVGIELVDGRPVLNDFWALMTNNTALASFAHVVVASLSVAGVFLAGISWHKLWQRRKAGIDTINKNGKLIAGESKLHPKSDYKVWLKSLRVGAIVAIVGFIGLTISGDVLGKLMFQQQPLKMASAEAACHEGAEFSILAIGNLSSNDCHDVSTLFSVPGVLGFLANGDFNQPVKGIKQLVPEYQEKYGANLPDEPMYGKYAGAEIDYVPLMIVTYWSFRLMIGFGALATGAVVIALWLTRKGIIPKSKLLARTALFSIALPFLASSLGWIFTEMGRQPFVVVPNPTGVDGVYLFTAAAVSPGVSATMLWVSVIALTSVYAVLCVIEVTLIKRLVQSGADAGLPPDEKSTKSDKTNQDKDDDALAFVY